MTNMMNKAQGFGLSLLTKVASSELLDQFHLRKFVEKSLYQGSKQGFKALGQTSQVFKSGKINQERLPHQQKNLFDLSLSEEQQMTAESMSQFAQEVLMNLAHQADHDAQFPKQLWQHLQDLGLNYYALPEALGGVATEQNVVSNVLIAEHLSKGDFSLTAGLLSTFSVINAITRWGSVEAQSEYLTSFSENPEIKATFAIQENTPAFNPYELKTKAIDKDGQYFISGEKTLVILGETADLLLVTAQKVDGHPDVFVVERDQSISFKRTQAMGLRASETVTLIFNQTKAIPLGNAEFNYRSFIELGNLMWCAMAVGTCEAVKSYCIEYANDRIAFGEPISHRQSVAFMIADMAIEIDAMRMLVLNAASLAEAGQPFHREAYLARLLCAEKSMKIGTDGVQILGGHGYTKEHPVERWYRDLRATAVLHSGLHA